MDAHARLHDGRILWNHADSHCQREQGGIMDTVMFQRVKDAHIREVINAYNEGYKMGKTEADSTLRERLKLCRNELCLRCGSYKNAHLGSCDGCRWKENYA